MDRQNFSEKISSPERQDTPYTNEGLELLHNDQIIIVHEPLAAEWMSTNYVFNEWDREPSLRMLVATSSGPLARRYANVFCSLDHPLELQRTQSAARNERGGHVMFTSPTSCLAGYRFDRIIVSDPEHKHSFDDFRFKDWMDRLPSCLMPRKWTRKETQ